jgi:signal peptidase
MLKTFKIAVSTLAVIVILAMVTTFSLFAAGKLPYKLYLIHTPSMGKTIPPGSVVLVREHQYHVGQVISFRVNGLTVTHRLIAINPSGTITTKGDANPTVDPWIATKSDIIGSVVRTSPILGYFWVFLFLNWHGPVSILLFILSLILMWMIYKEPSRAPPVRVTLET